MSVNYAAGLSDYAHKGKCGQQEYRDTETELKVKVDELVDLVQHSKHCVVLTGAGISTSTGIPDFRGPKGVWTLEEKGIEPNFATTFDDAKASYAHMALVALEKAGIVKFLITQNVDGLHIRSGFPRDRMSILHGDMFTEQCAKCNHQFVRSSCVKTMGLKYTGGSCIADSRRGNGCRGKLRDTILDWEDALPDHEIDRAIENSKKADVYLVLGSSLQIVPAGNLPLHSKKSGGKVISVNLQRTKHHKKTDIAIHSYIDVVLKELCQRLGVVVSQYTEPTPVLHSKHGDFKNRLYLNISLPQNHPLSRAKEVTDTTDNVNSSAADPKSDKDELLGNATNKLKRKNNLLYDDECCDMKKEFGAE